MFIEFFDIKRPAWDGDTLAALLARLEENGYQGLTWAFHDLVGRYAHAAAGRSLPAALARAEEFSDVLIPPAQPQARIFLHRRAPEVLRVVVAGRSRHEVRLAQTALKLHLEAVLGRLGDLLADDHSHATLARFRREVLPALHLEGNGARPPAARHPLAGPVLRAMRRQGAVRGRPTVLASQLAALVPEKPAEQIREALEQLTAEGALERWHVVVCRDSGRWLGSSASAEEMRAFLALTMECPHCGRRVSEEQADVAYRLTEQAPASLSDTRWLCDLVETTLRRLGVEAVAVQPGAGAVDGAACYQGAVILFRAADDAVDIGDLMRLQEQGRRLESDGWRVFPLLVADRPLGLDATGVGVTVVESTAALDAVLEQVLRAAREAGLSALLPPQLRPAGVAVADLLPAD